MSQSHEECVKDNENTTNDQQAQEQGSSEGGMVAETGAADIPQKEQSLQVMGDSDFPTPGIEGLQRDLEAMKEELQERADEDSKDNAQAPGPTFINLNQYVQSAKHSSFDSTYLLIAFLFIPQAYL